MQNYNTSDTMEQIKIIDSKLYKYVQVNKSAII